MKELISKAEQFAQAELGSDLSGHDWWHIQRVRLLAVQIAKRENANGLICELCALLHDIADEKINESKEAGLAKVHHWLVKHNVNDQVIEDVMTIISTMSYNGGKNPPMVSLEGKVVQDADRLDALGAIGIARAFLYSGWKGQPIHNPNIVDENMDYRSVNKTAVYHFYEKLLKIKDLLHTESAKEIAGSRHQFMEKYLDQFSMEWEGSDYKEL